MTLSWGWMSNSEEWEGDQVSHAGFILCCDFPLLVCACSWLLSITLLSAPLHISAWCEVCEL